MNLPHLLQTERKIAVLIEEHIFTQEFLCICMQACLTPQGFPTLQGRPLYHWLLKYIFGNSPIKFYQTWYDFALHAPDKWSLTPPTE